MEYNLPTLDDGYQIRASIRAEAQQLSRHFQAPLFSPRVQSSSSIQGEVLETMVVKFQWQIPGLRLLGRGGGGLEGGMRYVPASGPRVESRSLV